MRIESCKTCVDCGEIMLGIYSHTIRTVCSPCGGKPLVDYAKSPPKVRKEEAA